MDQVTGGSIKPSPLIIADDHPLFRGALRQLMSESPDLEVVGEAENGRKAIELCRSLRPDLVLMDVEMPQMDGLTATHEIKREFPDTAVLILTAFEDPDYLFDAIKKGAAGYILKTISPQEIIDAVRSVLSGESPLSPEISALLLRRLITEKLEKPQEVITTVERPREEAPERPLAKPLTPRESEVVRLVAWGQTNQDIARNLLISTSTVKKYVHRVITKLQVSDRTQAAVRAVELGLLEEVPR